MSRKMKGDWGMFEQILVALFILIIIILAVFFLFGVEFNRSRGESSLDKQKEVIFSSKLLLQSNIFTKEDNVLDDSKLDSFLDSQGCKDFQKLIGQKDVCLEIKRAKLFSGEDEIDCQSLEDTECNRWVLCERVCLEQGNFISARSPVNIYRTLEGETQLGILTLTKKV